MTLSGATSPVRANIEAILIKEYSTFPKTCITGASPFKLSNFPFRTSLAGVLPIRTDAVGVFYSPSRHGCNISWFTAKFPWFIILNAIKVNLKIYYNIYIYPFRKSYDSQCLDGSRYYIIYFCYRLSYPILILAPWVSFGLPVA